MGDPSKPCPRRVHLSRRHRHRPSDRGFTLIEVIIAITLLVIMIVPFANAYISSINVTTGANVREVAAMLADTALDKVRALDPTDEGYSVLLTGRTQTAVNTEWTGTLPHGVSLSSTSEAWCTATGTGCGTSANLPTTPTSQTVAGHTFETYYYVGSCYQQSGGTDPACTTSPATSITLYRVIVAVTWTESGNCGGTGCSYVTSTLISGSSDPVFNINASGTTTTTTTASTTTTTTASTTTTTHATTTTTVATTTTTTVAPTTTTTHATTTTTTVAPTTTTTTHCYHGC